MRKGRTSGESRGWIRRIVSQRFGGPVEIVERRLVRGGAVGNRSLNSRAKGFIICTGARGEMM